MKVYYFGCINAPGHYLWISRGDRYLPNMVGWVPWGNEMDSGLAPQGTMEEQGHAAIHHKKGWTLVSWWDRTVDTRSKCNSAIMAEGNHGFEQIKILLKEYWPEVAQRQTVELYTSTEDHEKRCPDCGLWMTIETRLGLVSEIKHRCYHCEDKENK